MCHAVTKVQLDSATMIHRAALDCLLFTQPLTEHYCFTSHHRVKRLAVFVCLLTIAYRAILYFCKKHFHMRFENIFQFLK